MRALEEGHLEIAELLLPHVPDLNAFGVDAWGTPWEGKYRGGLSPIFAAVVAGQLEFAKTLVARGASTELTLPRDAQSERYSELKLPAGTTLLKAADLARVFAAKEHRDASRQPFLAPDLVGRLALSAPAFLSAPALLSASRERCSCACSKTGHTTATKPSSWTRTTTTSKASTRSI